jgi:hypothetical protein
MRSDFADSPASNSAYSSKPGRYTTTCRIPPMSFGERRFYVTVFVIAHNVQHTHFERVIHFDMTFMGYNDNLSIHSRGAYFRPRLDWTIEAPSD